MSNQPLLRSIQDLRPAERRLLTAMRQLGYGRFESLRIHRGVLVLDPWPTTVRTVKFGNTATNRPVGGSAEFHLKKQTADLFAYVRSVDAGVIRVLEIRGGLPFSMEIAAERDGVQNGNDAGV